MKKVISMSIYELNWLEITQKVFEKSLKQLEAGSILNVSERRIREMVMQYKDSGVKGLISKKKGLLVTASSKGG